MAKEHGPTIKDAKLYEDLIEQGQPEERAARIANAHAAGTLDHNSTPLEHRTKAELYDEAKTIGIVGRSSMSKAELVKAIRKG